MSRNSPSYSYSSFPSPKQTPPSRTLSEMNEEEYLAFSSTNNHYTNFPQEYISPSSSFRYQPSPSSHNIISPSLSASISQFSPSPVKSISQKSKVRPINNNNNNNGSNNITQSIRNFIKFLLSSILPQRNSSSSLFSKKYSKIISPRLAKILSNLFFNLFSILFFSLFIFFCIQFYYFVGFYKTEWKSNSDVIWHVIGEIMIMSIILVLRFIFSLENADYDSEQYGEENVGILHEYFNLKEREFLFMLNNFSTFLIGYYTNTILFSLLWEFMVLFMGNALGFLNRSIMSLIVLFSNFICLILHWFDFSSLDTQESFLNCFSLVIMFLLWKKERTIKLLNNKHQNTFFTFYFTEELFILFPKALRIFDLFLKNNFNAELIVIVLFTIWFSTMLFNILDNYYPHILFGDGILVNYNKINESFLLSNHKIQNNNLVNPTPIESTTINNNSRSTTPRQQQRRYHIQQQQQHSGLSYQLH
ncbi:hypothetical protein ABK040_007797 [Willaertia magna]